MTANRGFLRAIRLMRDKVSSFERYPFSIPAVRMLDELELDPKITFLVGAGEGEATGHAPIPRNTSSTSPILMAYPGATIYHLGSEGIRSIAYEDTERFLITRDFLNGRDAFFRHLFEGHCEAR
jgi:predicted ATPase